MILSNQACLSSFSLKLEISKEFIKQGIPSEAIREYLLTLLNSNFETFRLNNPTLPADDYKFNIANMSKSGAQFDMEKLNHISKNVISMFTAEKVYSDSLEYSKNFDKELHDMLVANKDFCIKMFNIERNTIKPRKDISKYSDIMGLYYYFFNKKFNEKNYEFDERFSLSDITILLKRYIESYNENDEKQVWFDKIKVLGEDLGFASDMKVYKQNKDAFKGSYADIAGIIRMALTKEKNTPDLFEICKLLGKEEIAKRVSKLMA